MVTRDSIRENDNRVLRVEKDEARVLYEQYSQWARHMHTLVWVVTSFGIGISLAGLTLFNKLNQHQLVAAGVVCLIILLFCHVLAERNAAQCMYHWRLLNALEGHWGLRDLKANPDGPPLGFREGETKGSTRKARVRLMWACCFMWVLAIVAKLVPMVEHQVP